MAKFLWDQRNPWNFDLYTPEEVTKILTVRIISRYFPSNPLTKKERFKKVDSSVENDRNSLYGSINLKSV